MAFLFVVGWLVKSGVSIAVGGDDVLTCVVMRDGKDDGSFVIGVLVDRNTVVDVGDTVLVVGRVDNMGLVVGVCVVGGGTTTTDSSPLWLGLGLYILVGIGVRRLSGDGVIVGKGVVGVVVEVAVVLGGFVICLGRSGGSRPDDG